MTTATSVHPLTIQGQVDSPAVAWRPRVTTVMAQAAGGYIAANFLLIVARMLLVPNPRNGLLIFSLAALPVFAVPAGLVVGLFVWAGMELEGTRLNTASRSLIGVIMMALGGLALTLFFGWELPPPELQFWVLAMVIAPGIGMGVVTGSRLRLWHELVRKGDRVGPVLGVLAVLSGAVLRLLVPFLFMGSVIALIGIAQARGSQEIGFVWWVLACAHFATASVLLFVRLKTDVLLPLAVFASSSLIAVVLRFGWLEYVGIGYFAMWAVFLLTRWRQTQAALAVLKEEFSYYLMD